MKENNDTNLNNSHTNNSIPSPEELRRLFSSVGVESTLDRIGVYLFYRFIYLWIYNHNPCEDYDYEKKLQKYTTELISKFCDPHLLSHRNIRVIWDSMYKFTLYKSIAHININTFFNTYYSNYLGYVNPMVYLNSFYKRNKSNQMTFIELLILFHYLLVTVKKGLTSNFKYRLVPIPEYLAELILAHKQRYMKEFGILSDEELNDYPLILPNYKGKQVKTAGKVRKIPVYCTANKLRLNSRTAKEDGAEIPEEIISFEGADGTEEYDFANYIGDFYGSNYKYHALRDAMMTRGQVSYILGLTPADTFTRHYCDYKNSSLQMMLVEKLNDWCAIYKAWEYKPLQVSGTIQKRLSKTLYPFTADCTSGQLRLKIDHQLQSDIEITIASDRGIRGTITVYKEESNGKRGLLSSDP